MVGMITIKPIIGTTIDSKTLFVVVNVPNITMIATEKYTDQEMTIYGIDVAKLKDVFKRVKLPDSINFVPISDIVLFKKDDKHDVSVLLVNDATRIMRKPIAYEKKTKLGDGYIWKPSDIVYPSIFECPGYVYSKKYPIDAACLIESKLLTVYSSRIDMTQHNATFVGWANLMSHPNMDQYAEPISINDNSEHNFDETTDKLTISNEFNMFTINGESGMTINKQMINQYQSPNGTNDTSTSATLLQDGRIEIDGLCANMTQTGNIELIDCVDSLPQQWELVGSDVIHRETGVSFPDKAITSKLVTSEKKNINNKFPRWEKKFGKSVVLVSSDNPWYINKNTTQKIPYIAGDTLDDYTDYPKQYGIFSTKNAKNTIPTQPESGIEPFSVQQSKIENCPCLAAMHGAKLDPFEKIYLCIMMTLCIVFVVLICHII